MGKRKIAALGLVAAVAAVGMAAAPSSGSAAMEGIRKSGGLSELFLLDKLFRSSDSSIINTSRASLGNMFILDQLFPVTVAQVPAPSAAQTLSGRILIQVEQNGEAWYVRPSDNRRVSLGTPQQAFNYMAGAAVGINNADYNAFQGKAPANLSGRFLIKTEDAGKIVYVNPVNRALYTVEGPAGAANLIKTVGLGITDADLAKITVAQ